MKLSSSQRKAVLLLLVVFVPLIITELFLRSIQYGSLSFWQPHPVYGKSLIPDGRAWYTNEGRAYVRINQQGYHDRTHKLEKPNNTFRIAVLGDSFVEAVQISYEKSFWYLLSGQLKSCPALKDKQIETFGFGVSNYGTGHQLLMMRRDILNYQPDEIVLGFFQGNDITDNSAFNYSGPSPVFSIENNKMVVDNSFNQKPEFVKRLWLVKLKYYKLILKFRVLEVLRNSVKLIPTLFKLKKSAYLRRFDDGLVETNYQVKFELEFTKALELTQRLIKQLARESVAAGAGFSVLSIPHSSLLHPERLITENQMTKKTYDRYMIINSEISRFTEHNNINTVNLSRELQLYANDANQYLYGFENNRLGYGHFSEYGHQMTAQVLAKHICSKLDNS